MWKLRPSAHRMFYLQGPKALRPGHISGEFPNGGGVLVVTREAWDSVGGFDESYVGWGWEDSYFNGKLLLQWDWNILPGEAWHFHHPIQKDVSMRNPNKVKFKEFLDQNPMVQLKLAQKGIRLGVM